MKFHLTFVFNGNESVNEKFLEKVKKNNDIKKDLVVNLMTLMYLVFELNEKDEVYPENLRIGKVDDPTD